VLVVDDLAVVAEGLRVRGDPVAGPAGAWLVVDDPSGNPIELFQPK
jgi:hypothetical protein